MVNRISRRDVLRSAGAVALTAGSAGVLTAFAAGGGDARILRFALALEQLQADFYRAALGTKFVTGELAEYARVVRGHEVAHAEFLKAALGPSAGPAPSFQFQKALASRGAFERAAIAVEDLGVAAYDGQIPNLSPQALVPATEIVSVEARHAAWIRDLAGQPPAPDAADLPLSPGTVRTRLAAVGVTIGAAS